MVADLDILRIFTLLALGMAVNNVLYNLVRVYISTTPFILIGNESLLLETKAFIESNHSVLSPNQKCVMFFNDKNASTASAFIVAT